MVLPKPVVDFPCDLCNISCNSQNILEQHFAGKAHRKKVNKIRIEEERKDESKSMVTKTECKDVGQSGETKVKQICKVHPMQKLDHTPKEDEAGPSSANLSEDNIVANFSTAPQPSGSQAGGVTTTTTTGLQNADETAPNSGSAKGGSNANNLPWHCQLNGCGWTNLGWRQVCSKCRAPKPTDNKKAGPNSNTPAEQDKIGSETMASSKNMEAKMLPSLMQIKPSLRPNFTPPRHTGPPNRFTGQPLRMPGQMPPFRPPNSHNRMPMRPHFNDQPPMRPNLSEQPQMRPHFNNQPTMRPHFNDQQPVRPHFNDQPPVRPHFNNQPPMRPHFNDQQPMRPHFNDQPPVRPHFNDHQPMRPHFDNQPPLRPAQNHNMSNRMPQRFLNNQLPPPVRHPPPKQPWANKPSQPHMNLPPPRPGFGPTPLLGPRSLRPSEQTPDDLHGYHQSEHPPLAQAVARGLPNPSFSSRDSQKGPRTPPPPTGVNIKDTGAPDDKEQVSDSPTKKRKPASYADEIAQYKSSRTGESQNLEHDSPPKVKRPRLDLEEPPTQQTRKPCFDFQRGRCYKGSHCRFEHVYKREICRRFQRGQCSSKACPYDHVTEDEMEGNTVSYGDDDEEEGEITSKSSPRKEESRGSSRSRKESRRQEQQRGSYPPAEEEDRYRQEHRGWSEERNDFRVESDRENYASHSRRGGGWSREPEDTFESRRPSEGMEGDRKYDDYWKEFEQTEGPSPKKKYSRSDRSSRDTHSSKHKEEKVDQQPRLSYVEQKVVDCTTPLASLPYKDQLKKKEKDIADFVEELEQDVLEYNPDAEVWVDKQKQIHSTHFVKLDKIKESPVLEGYRNKCEFAIGVNPETNRITVGFKLEPRGQTSEVGSIEHLKHVPSAMKYIVSMLEMFLRGSSLPIYLEDSPVCGWQSAVVRLTQKGETMLILNFISQDANSRKLQQAKTDLLGFVESGTGAKFSITSLYFCQKIPGGPAATIEHLFGRERITEVLCDLEFAISPRAYFSVNTLGAELLNETISQTLGLSSSTSLLDLCCGTGSIGLSLARWVGQVIGIDSSSDAIADAKRNRISNRVDNAAFRLGSVEEMLEKVVGECRYPDIAVVIDPPPRTGLPVKAIRAIRSIPGIKRLVYIANDPRSSLKNMVDLARPTSTMFAGHPFMPTVLGPIDLFPHTSHYFTVIRFDRIPSFQSTPTKINREPGTELPSIRPPSFRGLDESGLSSAQKDWLNQTERMYGPGFDRSKWVADFKKQNHEAALRQVGGRVDQHETQPSPSAQTFEDPRTRHPGLNANRPSTNANRQPTNDHRGGERPADGLADFPPGRHPEGSRRDFAGRPPPQQQYPGQQQLHGREQHHHQPQQQHGEDDIPPMPKFPVPPSSGDPKEHQEYKRQHKIYSDWYAKYGQSYKRVAAIPIKEMPDPNKVPPGTDPKSWRKYCDETIAYWDKYNKVTQMKQSTDRDSGPSHDRRRF